jgi:hypothetical protein
MWRNQITGGMNLMGVSCPRSPLFHFSAPWLPWGEQLSSIMHSIDDALCSASTQAHSNGAKVP